MSILFEEIIFGPVWSRRLGVSLGINLLPVVHKLCTFDCLYCECGWTSLKNTVHSDLPSSQTVNDLLQIKLIEMKNAGDIPDSITFAGNGEPLLHPEFPEIIDNTVNLRNQYFPNAAITVLSNASMINNDKFINALMKTDKNMLKLDAGSEKYFKIINRPVIKINHDKIVDNLKKFKGKLIIQSLFIKGEYNGISFNSASDDEVAAWLNIINQIKPGLVVIYSISREPTAQNILKIPLDVLEGIASKVRNLGIKAEVYD
jgi:wyosine [tRNA(Phe)-imidazoG37] synthetase (radical SAM superfamily)